MSHLVPASICEMEIFSQHLWDGDFFSASLRWRGRFFIRIGLGLPANSHPSLLTCPDFFIVFVQIVYCIPQPSLIQKLSSQSICFFSIFFQIFSPYHFFISIQMFSLRKYFPHFISPSQSRYFFPSYFPYLSSPSQSNNYFPSPIISLFFFTVLLPPNYPFSSFLSL